jgi:hypothetical protein
LPNVFDEQDEICAEAYRAEALAEFDFGMSGINECVAQFVAGDFDVADEWIMLHELSSLEDEAKVLAGLWCAVAIVPREAFAVSHDEVIAIFFG